MMNVLQNDLCVRARGEHDAVESRVDPIPRCSWAPDQSIEAPGILSGVDRRLILTT